MKQLFQYIKRFFSSPKMWLFVAVWLICLLYVLFQGGKAAIMLFSMVTVVTLYVGSGSFSGINRIHGKRTIATRVDRGELMHAGDQVQVTLNVRVPGFIPFPYVIIREMLKRQNGSESWSFESSVAAGFSGSGELKFQTPPLERGRYYFTQTECAGKDIFGFVEHKGAFLAEGQFSVMPRTVYIPYWKLYNRNSILAGPQNARHSSRRETTQINGVRDYVYGDRISRIHWNATAKTGTWKSKEFEHESLPKTMLVLDAAKSHYPSSQSFETAVSTAASLLEYGGRERIEMGLCTLGGLPKVFLPSDGRAERQMMLDHLVDISPDGDSRLASRLERVAHLFPKGAYFIFISSAEGQPLMDVFRWSEKRGMSPCHIHIGMSTAAVSNGSFLPQSRGILSYSVASLQDLPKAVGGAG